MKSLYASPFLPRKLSFSTFCLALLTAVLLCGASAALSEGVPSQRPERVLYRFQGPPDGELPFSTPVTDKAGNLYGTTSGGDPSCPLVGCGTVFELSLDASGNWIQKTIHTFHNDANGYAPGGLVFDGSGNLYGGNASGGGTSTKCQNGCGTVFELSPNKDGGWTETTIYNFQGPDGAGPSGPLVFDPEGNLYGTAGGGLGQCINSSVYNCSDKIGYGTVFQLIPGAKGWKENVLYSFPFGGTDATEPFGGLVIDKNRNLYGTAQGGSAYGCNDNGAGCGTIFKIAPVNGAWVESVLLRFGEDTGLTSPNGGLTSDATGNLYGVTAGGGDINCVFGDNSSAPGCGSVYELSSRGVFTDLYDFAGGNDGTIPTGTLALRDGALYGNTEYGGGVGCFGGEGCGMVFELAPSQSGVWTEISLYRFAAGSDGQFPSGTGVIFGPGGNLYGATYAGGAPAGDGLGTIYEVAGTGSLDTPSAPIFSLVSGVYTYVPTVAIVDATPGAAIYYTTDGTTPTTASKLYTAPITVTSTVRLTAAAFVAGMPPSIASAVYVIAPPSSSTLDYSFGFNIGDPIQLNGYAQLDGSNLRLTKGQSFGMNGSAFNSNKLNIQSFTTYFTFQIGEPVADGFTFTIQNNKPEALGTGGGGLGYTLIGKSVAIKFDLYNNAGEGPDSTGLYVNGAVPTIPAINLTGTGIDLHSSDIFLAEMTYDGASLVLTLTDTATLATWSHTFTIDIPATVGGDTAYLGFTGGTGSETANQEIFSWSYVAGKPGASASPYAAPAVPEFANGFNPIDLTMNGSASISGTLLQLTDGGNYEAGSTFYATPLNIQAFTTDFTFQLTNPFLPLNQMADGFTFVIQNTADDAVGHAGGDLGYAGIGKSVAIKFDLHNNDGEGQNSTGLYIEGAPPTIPAISLAGTGIDLHSGHPFTAHIVYNGTDLALTLTDTVTLATWSHSFAVNIPATVGSHTAFVGFTGGTGDLSATQQILSWTYSNP